MRRGNKSGSTDLLDEFVQWIEENHNVVINIYEDDPGSFCTDSIKVNGQVTLAKNCSYIILYTSSKRIYAEELIICLLHEFGHHLHFEECNRYHEVYYDEFSSILREFTAWDYALSAFDKEIIPSKFRPNLRKFKYMMNVCMDDYAESY